MLALNNCCGSRRDTDLCGWTVSAATKSPDEKSGIVGEAKNPLKCGLLSSTTIHTMQYNI